MESTDESSKTFMHFIRKNLCVVIARKYLIFPIVVQNPPIFCKVFIIWASRKLYETLQPPFDNRDNFAEIAFCVLFRAY